MSGGWFFGSTATRRLPLLALVRRSLAEKYEVIRQIGRGGMASVFLARDIALKRPVALKILDLTRNAHGAMAHERFAFEGEATALQHHPNIVAIHAIDSAPGFEYIVMQYVDGVSLGKAFARGVPIDVALHILDQVAHALQHAHDHEIIHRDIKPDNIMIDRHGKAIVTDFGIARSKQSSVNTQTGLFLGTLNFASPERLTGAKGGPASDQYSLGVLAYWLIMGRLPFTGSDAQLFYAHVYSPPAPLVSNDCPADVARAVMKMLEKSPANRWTSCAEVAGVFARHLPIDRTPVCDKIRALVPFELAPTEKGFYVPEEGGAPSRALPARPWLVALLVLVLIVGGLSSPLTPWQRTPLVTLVSAPVTSTPIHVNGTGRDALSNTSRDTLTAGSATPPPAPNQNGGRAQGPSVKSDERQRAAGGRGLESADIHGSAATLPDTMGIKQRLQAAQTRVDQSTTTAGPLLAQFDALERQLRLLAQNADSLDARARDDSQVVADRAAHQVVTRDAVRAAQLAANAPGALQSALTALQSAVSEGNTADMMLREAEDAWHKSLPKAKDARAFRDSVGAQVERAKPAADTMRGDVARDSATVATLTDSLKRVRARKSGSLSNHE
jgi:serine/threonine protein kinase